MYTHDYFETCCHGHEEFHASRGKHLPLRLQIPLELAEVRAGMTVVDIGCGRGEIAYHCASAGAMVYGMDYAEEALGIADEMVCAVAAQEVREKIRLLRANARQLPFEEATADRIFMLDVVEHLYPHELEEALQEAYRVLRPTGRLIVHTMPNLWYYRFGYPLYRAVQRLRGERLPANPRARWDYSHVHVNEQTPTTLHRALRAAGLETRVWLQSTQQYEYEANPIVRAGMQALTRIYPFRWIFCNDIFAVGTRR